MKTIVSRDNASFKELRDLARAARRQRRAGRTLLDGAHLVATALDRGLVPELLAFDEDAFARPEIAALRARAGAVPALCLRGALFGEISELASSSGVLARIAVPPAPTSLPAGDCLLLDAVQDAGNVGALLRTAAATDVRDVLLGSGCAGAWTPRVLRAAQGAQFGLRLHEQVDLAAFLRGYPGTAIAAVAHGGASLYALDLAPPLAWLFGNEGAGVAAELLAAAPVRATIPLAAGCESLNVAAAAAVCLFEMRRQRGQMRIAR